MILVLIVLPVGTTKTATASGKVIWERETEYQYARVIEDADGERRLELNEGQAVHSVYRKGEWLTGGYWDEMLVLPLRRRPTPPKRVAILGSAAGTTARAMAHYFPDVHIDAVEIDPDVTEVGRELFDLRGTNITTHDRRRAARGCRPRTATYDAILVDAYRQPYIPFYLATRGVLRRGQGAAHPRRRGRRSTSATRASPTSSEKVLTATMRASFGQDRVWRDPVEDDQHDAARDHHRRRPRRAVSARPSCPARCGRSPCRPPTGSRPACAAAASTPTTGHRSSGWSTPRSPRSRSRPSDHRSIFVAQPTGRASQ